MIKQIPPSPLGMSMIATLALVAPLIAQTPDAADTKSIQSLETAVAARPVASSDEKRQFVVAVVELSRLLPNPDDQIRFLRKAADERQADINLAYDVAAEAQKRMRRWREIDKSLISEEVKASLDRLMDVIKPIIDLFEPAELVKRFQGLLADPAKIEELTPEEKSALFSRGIPAVQLAIRSDSADARPRELADLLAGRVTGLPALPALLTNANNTLNQSEIRTGFPDSPAASATEVMSLILARSLGLDGEDLRPGGDLDKPEYWQLKAESFSARHLWRWETMARILQAANSIDAASRASAVASATQTWAKVEEVYNAFAESNAAGPEAWPAVRDWLARLGDGTPAVLDSRDKLPLSADFRSRGRILRNKLEAEFLQAKNANDIDGAFRLLQLAKNAEITLTGLPAGGDATIDAESLKRVIGYRGQAKPGEIHLFVELFQTGVAGGNGGALHAFIIRTPSATIGATSEFEPDQWLTAEATTGGLSNLLTQAIGPLADSANLHVVVAMDGLPRGVDWSDAEKALLNQVSGPQGWLAYLPTAAVFAKNSAWTLTPTIRAWYRSLDPAARATGLSFSNTACEIRNFGLSDVNENLKHGLVKIVSKGASRPQSELPCGDGWTKLSRQVASDRGGGVLNIPMLVAADRKR